MGRGLGVRRAARRGDELLVPRDGGRRRARRGPCGAGRVQPEAHVAVVAEELGFTPGQLASPAFAEVFGGNTLLPGMDPVASNYGGHQFGHWAGQLGDGRAISLGECITAAGGRRELQLMGAGMTPYSRSNGMPGSGVPK